MRLGIRSKLLVMMLAVSISSIAVISVLAYFGSSSALSDTVTDRLTSQRATLSDDIERYFDTVEGQALTLAQDLMMVEAALEFRVGWNQLADASIDADELAELENVYEGIVGELSDLDSKRTADEYLPAGGTAQYLQHRYIAGAERNEPIDIDDAGDGTFYNRAHMRYQPILRNFIQRFRYDDLFIVDPDTGDVLYSVAKEMDFGTNLVVGPHRTTNFARLVADISSDPREGHVGFVDFEFFAPTRFQPTGFVGSPIVNPSNDEVVGILVLQVPVVQIDEVMTAGRNWEVRGFGETGEAYVVGPDLTIRSQARHFVEDPDDFRADALSVGIDQRTVDLIEESGGPALRLPVDTEASRRGLSGQTDTRVSNDYLGRETLSSFQPVDVGGLRWTVVAQVTLDEANAPIRDLQRLMLVATGLIVLALTVFAMFMAGKFVRPMGKLMDWAVAVRSGDFDGNLDIKTRDEFGELGTVLNQSAAMLRSGRDVMREQNARNDALISSLMPEQIAERLKTGERRIADSYPNVTVVTAQIIGFYRFTAGLDFEASNAVHNELADMVDELGERYDMERVSLHGSEFVMVCGLSKPRLDHQKRSLDFAVDLRDYTSSFASQRVAEGASPLGVAMGVHSGNVIAGIIGEARPSFDVWGETVVASDVLAGAARKNEILVTSGTREHLDRLFVFDDHDDATFGSVTIPCAALIGRAEEVETRAEQTPAQAIDIAVSPS